MDICPVCCVTQRGAWVGGPRTFFFGYGFSALDRYLDVLIPKKPNAKAWTQSLDPKA